MRRGAGACTQAAWGGQCCGTAARRLNGAAWGLWARRPAPPPPPKHRPCRHPLRGTSDADLVVAALAQLTHPLRVGVCGGVGGGVVGRGGGACVGGRAGAAAGAGSSSRGSRRCQQQQQPAGEGWKAPRRGQGGGGWSVWGGGQGGVESAAHLVHLVARLLPHLEVLHPYRTGAVHRHLRRGVWVWVCGWCGVG